MQSEWWVLPHYPTQESGEQRYGQLGGQGALLGCDHILEGAWRDPLGCRSPRFSVRDTCSLLGP